MIGGCFSMRVFPLTCYMLDLDTATCPWLVLLDRGESGRGRATFGFLSRETLERGIEGAGEGATVPTC